MKTKTLIACLATGLLTLGQPARAAGTPTTAPSHTATFESRHHARQIHQPAILSQPGVSGVIPRAIRGGNPLEMLSPFAANLSNAAAAIEAARRFPSIDILINNLGVYEPKPFEQITDDDWYAIIEANFMSGVRLSRHYMSRMKAANWGRIIFISSESAVNIPVEMIHYGVTKTMQVALARGLAETTAGTAVTVNSVLAGPTRSEGVEKFLMDMARTKNVTPGDMEKEFFRTARPSSLLQRFAAIDEVAAFVTFVASPLSSAINGAALRVEGGLVRSIF